MIGALAGVAGAVILIGAASVLPRERRPHFFAILLGVAAGIYTGADLAAGVLATTGLAALAGFVLAAAFSMDRPGVLALLWFAHAAWDAFHYVGGLPVRLPADYLIACFAADIVWGVWLFSLRPRSAVVQPDA